MTGRSTSTEEFQNIKRLIREERDAEVASVVNTDFDGSTAIHSDYGFAMKRWLRDTTTFTPPSLPLPAVDEDLGMLDTGDVFYKTIVSPAALAALGYDYHDDPESDSRVQVTKRLDKTEVAALIAKTLEMCEYDAEFVVHHQELIRDGLSSEHEEKGILWVVPIFR